MYGPLEQFRSAMLNPANTTRSKELLMDSAGSVEVFYSPFEYVNSEARLVIVGITPGPTQAASALATFRAGAGVKNEDMLLRAVKRESSFSGDLFRRNLTRQLDDWGIQNWLGLSTCTELFGSADHLVHTTSLLRYPVFVNQQKYEGRTPAITQHPLLKRHLLTYFVSEVTTLQDALFVGLGPTVSSTLLWLAAEGYIAADRVATGMMHGSGENTYRINYILSDRSSSAPHRTNPSKYDAGREAFRRRYLAPVPPYLPPAPTAVGFGNSSSASPSSLIAPMPRSSQRARTTLGTAYGGERLPAEALRHELDDVLQFLKTKGASIEHRTDKLVQMHLLGGEVAYLNTKKTRRNAVFLTLAPQMDPAKLARTPGAAAVKETFHSNMVLFNKRLRNGKTPTAYGWEVRCDSFGELEAFLLHL